MGKLRVSSPGKKKKNMTMISQIVHRKRDGVTESEVVPHVNSLSRAAQDVLTKVRVLREYTEATGFKTTKSQNDLIQSLNGDDLASVLLILKNATTVPVPSLIPIHPYKR